jgi:DNA-directed RNA polymerase beta' subunit
MLNAHRYNDKTSSIERIDFTILGNREIKKMSALDKNTSGLLVPDLYDNTEPKRNGLIDQRMGITSNELICTTCGFNTNYCHGHFGHLDLSEPVYHMGFFDHIISILRCICIKCSKLLVYKNEDEIIEILKNKTGKNRLNEIKSMVKNINLCQKSHYGCGAPVPKIKSEKKKSTVEINIIAEYTTNANNENEKKVLKDILTPKMVYNILNNISDNDCLILGMDPKKSRPEDMIHKTFPVPPVQVRPSVRGDFSSSTTKEDSLTVKLADILKADIRINKHKENMNENTAKYFQDHIAYLQYHIAVYYDNESLKLPQSEQKGVLTKSLASRLKGKEGRIRNNLMGKRTDFSGRTVITPDPTLSINQLGVPISIARNITFPEIVTPYNIEELSKLVRNGRDIYPGANWVIPNSNTDNDSRGPQVIDLRWRKDFIELKYGDIVERHTQNDDMFLLNRQPTLHKLSMMGHRCKIIDNPNYCTFRINPNVTTPYNADFDGDEMNIFCPQSIETQIELEAIADLKLQIITPQSSAPIIAMQQDQLFGAYNLTTEYYEFNWRSAMNLLSSVKLSNFDNIPKNKIYTGKDIFSYLIPDKINLLKGDRNKPDIYIKNGKIVSGRLAKSALGVGAKNSIVQLIWDEYGVDDTQKFLDNTTNLTNNYNMFHGMTVGIKDLHIKDILLGQMNELYASKKLEILHEISEVENNPDMITKELFEISVNQKLSVIRDEVSKLVKKNSLSDNNFEIMIESGSKGKDINLAQMVGCLGQQDYHGGRMLKNYNDRSLPYFFKNDDRAESRGFVERSFMRGLNLTDFIFHALSAREGLIDQTVRSVTPDTKIVVIENNIPNVIEIGKWIDNKIDPIKKSNPELIEKDKNNFELVKVNNIQIPTVNENGKVTWGEVSAITRHDPGLQLFEIVTKGGRKVIVPESKSLLIWNSENNKFEEKLTGEVKINDKVPVTMNLINPPLIKNNIDMTEFFPKDKYIYGTDFIIAKKEMNIAMENRDKIPIGWWEQNNGKNFILPYDSKAKFQRTQVRSNNDNIKIGYIYPYGAKKENIQIPERFELNKLNGQFIGLFLADGNIDIDSGYIQITKNNSKVRDFTIKWFEKYGINYREEIKENNIGISSCIRGYSRLMGKFITELVGHGSHNKHIPVQTINAPEEFIIGLLDGYISGDGTIGSNNIETSSSSKELIEGVNYCLSRLGIFSKLSISKINPDEKGIKHLTDTFRLTIRGQWANILKLKVKTLINNEKNIKLDNMISSEIHKNYKELNDVVLDKIIEINHVKNKYNKLYDLTVPSTNNFIIYNGLGVYDTAESGYIQRKLIKSTEDFMVNYDGTVRNAVGRIQQFVYGDSGADTVKQYQYNFKIMNMGNTEIKNIFKFTKDELKKVKSWSDKDNNEYYDYIINMRNHLRKTQIKATLNYLTLNTSYMIPVNLVRIINNFRYEDDNKNPCMEPKFIIDMINNIVNETKLYCLTDKEKKDHNSIKNKDDKTAKTVLKYALYDIFNLKNCIFNYKFSKEKLNEISNLIINGFNKNIVEPGEMVGIIGAQSLGEPVTQLMLNAFHSSGIGGKGGTNIGVDRIKEVFSLSKNPKEPYMIIYLDKNHRSKKDYANKIASHIKYTTIKDLRNKIEIFYDPNPGKDDSFMKKDNIKHIFHTHQPTKQACSNSIDGLPWLMRIEFDKEKLLNKEVTLLDIKSKFCFYWEKRFLDVKSLKREKRQILDKINQLAILSNNDNNDIPIIHIRFSMNNFNSSTLIDFMDMFIDDFKLKGIDSIQEIRGGDKAVEERIISFDNEDNIITNDNEYVIYTRGINMDAIKNIIGIDLNRTYCNDIITTFEKFGIEAARTLIIREIINVLTSNGSGTNFQHISIFGDLMTNVGTLTSVDRFGINKLDTDPLARASFEKTVDQLIEASIFNQVDKMKSVSSRIMAGLCIKGGTGLCNIILDKDFIENSEYTTDIGQLYKKTYNDIVPTQEEEEEKEDNVFIPTF